MRVEPCKYEWNAVIALLQLIHAMWGRDIGGLMEKGKGRFSRFTKKSGGGGPADS